MKVIVGLSGGVDSSAAAYVLLQKGYEVEAMFMQNWNNTTGTLHGSCTWEDDAAIARMTAQRLGVPFHFIDLSEEYMRRVAEYMFHEYSVGRTPNPDVLCNREIKFDAFLKAALHCGAEMVATGHYCRKEEVVVNGQKTYNLLAGTDCNKDQSYFLCQLSQEQLKYAMFPIGEMTKPEVRRIATTAGLPAATRKDSQGICFVGKVDLPTFLQQKITSREGNIVEIPKDYMPTEHPCNEPRYLAMPHHYTTDMGSIAGQHIGAWFYTIGQRKGLGVGGHKEPLFVLGTDVDSNVVYVGEGREHKGLWQQGVWIDSSEVHWIRTDMRMQAGDRRDYNVRIRYRQPLQQAVIYAYEEGLLIVFAEPQWGIAQGQFAAWYIGDCLIGSGAISKPHL
jgi:tRNA-specific 2-thiouridylase